jgi:hypothetical protein
MRKAIYSGPNRSGICVCGHGWQEHHLGMVVRPEAIETDDGPEAYIPQECEHFGSNEMGGLDADGNPHCSAYNDTLADSTTDQR